MLPHLVVQLARDVMALLLLDGHQLPEQLLAGRLGLLVPGDFRLQRFIRLGQLGGALGHALFQAVVRPRAAPPRPACAVTSRMLH